MQVMCVRMGEEASVAGAEWTRRVVEMRAGKHGGGVRLGTSSCINLQTMEGIGVKWNAIRGFQAEL